ENAQASQMQVPSESQFEMSFLMGTMGLNGDVKPLSVQTLTVIRESQLSLWNQKKLPQTGLVRRQEAILAAGHFEAYNYWLFKGARAGEFNEWSKDHQTQFQA